MPTPRPRCRSGTSGRLCGVALPVDRGGVKMLGPCRPRVACHTRAPFREFKDFGHAGFYDDTPDSTATRLHRLRHACGSARTAWSSPDPLRRNSLPNLA
jgi:hypothetical protein